MRAVQLVQVGKPLEDAEVALPTIGSSEILVRVAACGICHSDAHYRGGISAIDLLPLTLGHEVAGRIETVGEEVTHVSPNDRVYVHYLVSCGCCDFCLRGHEQFCVKGQMIGKHRAGGYAEFIKVPGRNVFVLPDEIPFEHGAIMMCSSATALHALNKARLQSSDALAIFGFGGLGFSAFQLAKAFGCREVYVVDINPAKLASIKEAGGIAIDATARDPVAADSRSNRRKRSGCLDRTRWICHYHGTSRPMPRGFRPCRARRPDRGVNVSPSLYRDHQQGSRDSRGFRSPGRGLSSLMQFARRGKLVFRKTRCALSILTRRRLTRRWMQLKIPPITSEP